MRLNRNENMTITTAQPAGIDAGVITVGSALRWNGAGNLSLDADNAIVVDRVIRTDGAGDTTLNGMIVASVAPRFTLATGSDFALNAANPTGSFRAIDVSLVVTTTDGTITVGGPSEASQVTLRNDTAVTPASTAGNTGTGPRDALVISAGPRFENLAGADVLQASDRSAGWLLYMDEFATLVGTRPTSGTFDLYDRPFATTAPTTSPAGGLEDTHETVENPCGVAVNLGSTGREGCVCVTVTETLREQR